MAGAADLLAEADAELTRALVAALDDKDSTVSKNAARVLPTLRNQQGIDALCAVWAKGRDKRLGEIIAHCRYIAQKPVELTALTALKCGSPANVDSSDAVPFFLQLLDDPDEVLRAGAMASLENTSPGPAQDALCEEAIHSPSGPAARLCLRTGKRPRDHDRLCVFLFVTRQLDEYLTEDDEFENVRMELQRADAAVRANIMEVYRSGDNRVAGLIEAKPKSLTELSDDELGHFVQVCARHQQWTKLFDACLAMPLRFSVPALALLQQAGWEPEPSDLGSMYRQLLADVGDGALSALNKPEATSPLFEQWVGRGAAGEFAQRDEAELCQRLTTVAPPEGVAIVVAMAAKGSVSQATRKAVMENPHWLIRLAGHAAGIHPPLLAGTSADSNYWINELALAGGILDFWPAKAEMPADLERLSAGPPEAWTGRLGGARKALRTILSYRNIGIVVDDFVVEADEYAVVVDDAD